MGSSFLQVRFLEKKKLFRKIAIKKRNIELWERAIIYLARAVKCKRKKKKKEKKESVFNLSTTYVNKRLCEHGTSID